MNTRSRKGKPLALVMEAVRVAIENVKEAQGDE